VKAMSKYPEKKKTKQEQKQIPATKAKQIKSAELNDAELDKVAAGSFSFGTPSVVQKRKVE
jgi:hypothetical protein